ncbi:hypothetical protein V6L77_19105 [Pannonibacter sp. Pt2-lr]
MLVRLGGTTLDLARLRKLQHLFENMSLDAADCLLTSWRHRSEIIEGEIQQSAAARLLQPGAPAQASALRMLPALANVLCQPTGPHRAPCLRRAASPATDKESRVNARSSPPRQ